MKIFKIALVITLSIFLSGCQWLNELKIFNHSTKPITIKYSLTEDSASGYFNKNPNIYILGEDGEPNYDSIISSGIISDSIGTTILLKSGHVLIMGDIENSIDPHVLKNDPHFNLSKFSIESENDYITAQGNLIPLLFETDGKREFGMTIK
jgi:hypothetical protein